MRNEDLDVRFEEMEEHPHVNERYKTMNSAGLGYGSQISKKIKVLKHVNDVIQEKMKLGRENRIIKKEFA